MSGAHVTVLEFRSTVRMQIPAQPAQLRLVRLVAADLAAQVDFDLEGISEMQMAADEAGSQLATVAAPGEKLYCEFRSRDRRIDLLISTVTSDGATTLDDSTFGWRVLREFTDAVAVVRGAAARPVELGGPANYWLGIRMSKRDGPLRSG